MADICIHCGRPKAEKLADWDNAHCMRSDERCSIVAPYDRTEARLRAQLKAANERNARLEREATAWRALAEWERSPGRHRAVVWEDTAKPWINTLDEHENCENGNGDTVQAAAIDLVEKLGLLATYDQARAEVEA